MKATGKGLKTKADNKSSGSLHPAGNSTINPITID
jgi:hypothetical protein